METQITTIDDNARGAIIQSPDANPIAPLLAAITQSGITPDNADALGKVLAMYERMEAQRAAKDFAAAFAAVQAEMPAVQATKAVPGNGGEIRYTFAPFDEIMRTVQPILARRGFSVSFDSRVEDGRTIALCTLTHASGHSRTNQFAVRGGKGPPGTNDAQADGSARSYARRYALCDALNISIDHDNDARNEGGPIDADTAADIERRVLAVGGNPDRFLALAGVRSFAEIPDGKLPAVLKALEDRERAKAAEVKPAEPAKPSREFPNVGLWRTEMLEGFAKRGAKNPDAAFTRSVATGSYKSYLDVPADRRGLAWDALHAGKLDKFFAD